MSSRESRHGRDDGHINMLLLVPVRRRRHIVKEGKVVVLVPRTNSRVLRWFTGRLGYDPMIRVNLDAKGSFIWEKMDGTRSVARICSEMKDEMGADFGKDAGSCEARVCAHLRTMADSGLIAFKRDSIERARGAPRREVPGR